MNIIVVGCGRVGAELAYRLYKRGHRVVVIDQAAEAFENLPPDFVGRTVEGDALNQMTMHRAEIEKADGMAVVTNSDSLNAVTAHLGRRFYKVPNVVVRNFDPRFRSLCEAFDLQAVSSSSWGAQRMEELLYHMEMRTVFSAGNGEVEIYEFNILPGWAGIPLQELLPEKECFPIGLTRQGRAVIPAVDEILHEDDVLLVSATFDGIEALRARLVQKR